MAMLMTYYPLVKTIYKSNVKVACSGSADSHGICHSWGQLVLTSGQCTALIDREETYVTESF